MIIVITEEGQEIELYDPGDIYEGLMKGNQDLVNLGLPSLYTLNRSVMETENDEDGYAYEVVDLIVSGLNHQELQEELDYLEKRIENEDIDVIDYVERRKLFTGYRLLGITPGEGLIHAIRRNPGIGGIKSLVEFTS